jgi:hypothetical protein
VAVLVETNAMEQLFFMAPQVDESALSDVFLCDIGDTGTQQVWLVSIEY